MCAQMPTGLDTPSTGGLLGGMTAGGMGSGSHGAPPLTPFTMTLNSMEWPSPRGATPVGFSPGLLTTAGYAASSFQDLVVKGTAISGQDATTNNNNKRDAPDEPEPQPKSVAQGKPKRQRAA